MLAELFWAASVWSLVRGAKQAKQCWRLGQLLVPHSQYQSVSFWSVYSLLLPESLGEAECGHHVMVVVSLR